MSRTANKPLEPPEIHHLNAALGWLGLGNLVEAKAELTGIDASRQHHPDVLEVHWLLCAEEQNWEEGLQMARALVEVAPGRASGWLHQAYALRRVPSGGLQAAREALLQALDKFPKEPTFAYNLACYACQLGQLDTARDYFKRAMKIGGREPIKRMALEDSDLEALWEEIESL